MDQCGWMMPCILSYNKFVLLQANAERVIGIFVCVVCFAYAGAGVVSAGYF